MPEPIVPLDLYTEFRNVVTSDRFEQNSAVRTYRLLINSCPPANQYLLLYVLDLLAVFAHKSELNRMDAHNLAIIFQPGILSHPSMLQSKDEHLVAVRVLEFLIPTSNTLCLHYRHHRRLTFGQKSLLCRVQLPVMLLYILLTLTRNSATW